MTLLHELKNTDRPSKSRKRCGRGPSSGIGKTCGRGFNGAGSRSGYKRRHGTEGGQLPLYRRLPTRGFSNARFTTRYVVVNVGQLSKVFKEGDTVDLDSLLSHGLISNRNSKIKILGEGQITISLTVEAHIFSKSATEKLEKSNCNIKIRES